MIASPIWPGYNPNDPVHQTVRAYLTMDIQASPEAAQELLEKIAAVRSGSLPSWERLGNAYCLSVFPDHAVIEDDYSKEPGASCQVELPLFVTAIQAWLQAITNS